MTRRVRQIESVASEKDFRPGVCLYQPRQIGVDSPGRKSAQVRVADDEERSIEKGHGVGKADDKSTSAG